MEKCLFLECKLPDVFHCICAGKDLVFYDQVWVSNLLIICYIQCQVYDA